MKLTLEQALQKGIEAHKAGNVQEANRYYNAILTANPKHADANHNVGVLAVGVGKVEEALPFFETALEANPTIAQFWISYIDALLKLDRLTDAKTVFDQAKGKGAKGDGFDNLQSRLTNLVQSEGYQTDQEILAKAVVLRESGKYDGAIDLLLNQIKLSPTDPNIPALLSHCYILNDNLEQAKIYLDSAKNINPNMASIGWNETRLLLNQRKVDEALVIAQKYHKLFPDDVEGMGILGSCLRASGGFDESLKYLNKAILLNPNYSEALINRGLISFDKKEKANALTDLERAYYLKPHIKQIWVLLLNLKIEFKKFEDAISLGKKMVESDPLDEKIFIIIGLCHQQLNDYDQAVIFYKQALNIKPDYAEAYNNMGVAFNDQGKLEKAIEAYNKAISIKLDYVEAYNNMGVVIKDQGKLEKAIEAYNKAISIKPDFAEAYSNMGNALQDQGKLEKAIEAYNKAISIKPDLADAYWGLSGTAAEISESKKWVTKCLEADPSHLKAKLTLPALQFYEGNKSKFNEMITSPLKDHAFMRSFTWAFNLPTLPPLHFNRWALFDHMISLSKKDRPFYEFGVWRGEAFRYLIKTLKKGYGFDTFEGLPEDWHNEKAGTYSSDGNIPKIKGGKFIVGKFEDTLPDFFAEERPMASIINFDADLYSSTICALNFSKPVIDQHTILIFDEFIFNDNWELDEYKALQEFCANNQYTYDVIAISFFTKQVAVKIIGI